MRNFLKNLYDRVFNRVKKPIPFEKLSPELKRVRIAEDVIEQINLSIYTANKGSTFKNLYLDGNYVYSSDSAELNIKDNFERITNCQVCAMGACLMSLVKFENTLNFNNLGTNAFYQKESPASILLSSVFETHQLALIETAFEGSYNDSSTQRLGRYAFEIKEISVEDENKCKEFYQKYNNPTMRLEAIMKNIITNNGTFIP